MGKDPAMERVGIVRLLGDFDNLDMFLHVHYSSSQICVSDLKAHKEYCFYFIFSNFFGPLKQNRGLA